MHVASLFPVPAVPELNQLFHEIELNELMQTELVRDDDGSPDSH